MIIKRVANFLKTLINRIRFNHLIRSPLFYNPEHMIDEATGKYRMIDIVTLVCEHKFWQEVDSELKRKQSSKGVLCERCLLDEFIDTKGSVWGMREFKKWERDWKVRV